MTQHQTIPLSKLKASKLNVRKTGGKAIEELAASIRSSGLQQNLGVVQTGESFGVVFGGRRLRALQQLHKAGELPTELADGIPCRVLQPDEAQEASLAENTIREAMHPLDQFTAFQALVDEGKSEADVAASFGVTETVVRQRLRLARVSPKLLKAYGDGEMRLDQLQAFAITDDHARQESHWKNVRGNEWQSGAENIRRHLLNSEVSGTDARAQLVGVDAYVAAGGQVRRDLFSNTVILLDLPLLDSLAEDALEEAAELVRAEGWSWVEVGGERLAWNAPKVEGADWELTEQEAAELDALEQDDAQTVATQFRISQLDSSRYTAEQMEVAGARVLLSPGGLAIYRGLLKEGAEAPPPAAHEDEQGSDHKVQVGTHERAARKPGDPAFAAVQRMQAEATAIVQLQVARAPHIAMALLVTRLAADIYDGWNKPRRWVHIGREAAGRAPGPLAALMRESAAGAQLSNIEAEWKKKLPAKATGLAEWAVEQEPRVLHELLAFLVARELDAVDISAGAKDGVVELARVARADIAADWRPTEEWLGTLPKPVIIAMAQDAAGKKAAAPLEKLKKDELPAAALPLFPAGWLPRALRAAEKPRKEKAPRGKAAAAGDVA